IAPCRMIRSSSSTRILRRPGAPGADAKQRHLPWARSPAWGSPVARPRRKEVYRRACVACLMAPLSGHSKRAATVARLLKRFDLQPGGIGRRSEWIKRRHRRGAKELQDPLLGVNQVQKI